MAGAAEHEKNLFLSDDTDLLSHRAETFRSKLIADFNLLDTISETGRHLEPPKLYTTDIEGKSLLIILDFLMSQHFAYIVSVHE